ncbi:MAG TPA: hypothetical protein PLV58_04980 [Campylobacterales bacterium]|nr:hypothetical protein [Campylobacterales bacterium]
MKKLVVSLSLIIGASSALLAAGPNNPANFETAKANMSQMADKRISIIKEFKSCVEAAKDNAALKECRKKEADAMQATRPKRGPGDPGAPKGEMGPPEPGMGKPGM